MRVLPLSVRISTHWLTTVLILTVIGVILFDHHVATTSSPAPHRAVITREAKIYSAIVRYFLSRNDLSAGTQKWNAIYIRPKQRIGVTLPFMSDTSFSLSELKDGEPLPDDLIVALGNLAPKVDFLRGWFYPKATTMILAFSPIYSQTNGTVLVYAEDIEAGYIVQLTHVEDIWRVQNITMIWIA